MLSSTSPLSVLTCKTIFSVVSLSVRSAAILYPLKLSHICLLELKEPEKYFTYDVLFDPAQAAEHLRLYEEGKGGSLFSLGIVGAHMNSLDMVSSRAQEIQATAPKSATAPGLSEQYEIIRDLAAQGHAELEIASLPGFYSFPSTSSCYTLRWLSGSHA